MLGVGSLSDYALASYSRDGIITTVSVDKGSLTLTGKAILHSTTSHIIKGSLHLTGKDIPFYRVIVTPRSLSLTAKQIGAITKEPVTKGSLTLTAKPAVFFTTFGVVNGSLHLTGKSIQISSALLASNGSLHLTSYPATTTSTQSMEPGHLTLTGHDFFVGRVIVTPGYLTLNGQNITTMDRFTIEPNSLHLRPGGPIALIPIGGSSGSKRRLPKNYRAGFEPVTRKYIPAAKEPQRNPLPPFKAEAPRVAPATPAPGGPKAALDLKALLGGIAAAERTRANTMDEDDAADIAAVLELLD